MEFYLERNNKDREMIEFYTTRKSGKTYVWGMFHSDFLYEGSVAQDILDQLEDGPVKVKMGVVK